MARTTKSRRPSPAVRVGPSEPGHLAEASAPAPAGTLGDVLAWTRYLPRALMGRRAATPPPGPPPPILVERAGLGAALYSALAGAGDDRAEALEGVHAAWAGNNILVLDQAARVKSWLEEAGVPFAALKGLAGIARFFGADVAARPLSDVDILVHRADFARALSVLEARGLQRIKPKKPLTDRWATEVALVAVRGRTRTIVDVHQSFHNWPLMASLAPWVLRSREEVDGWPVPSVPASLLVIAAHRFRHGFHGDARELLDAALLMSLAADPDWDELIAAARARDLVPALYVVLRQADFWFQGESGGRDVIERIGKEVGPLRAKALDLLVPIEAGVTGGARLPSGFLGQYASMPLGTTRLLPAGLAMATYVASRTGDEVLRLIER